MSLIWKNNKALILILLIQLTVILYIYEAITAANDGHFVYMLDDPYIFFSLAQHHFLGTTADIIANPSSSLLGLYIITAFHSLFGIYLPLILNTVASLLCTLLVWKTLNLIIDHKNDFAATSLKIAFTLFFLITTNQIALIFTGMEHTIQVLLCTLTFYGIIREHHHKQLDWWLIITIILLPLWRYDTLSVFISAVIFLYLRNYIRLSLLCIVSVSLIITGYFAWWHSIGQPFFPTSLIVRSIQIRQITYFLQSHDVSTSLFVLCIITAIHAFCAILYGLKNYIRSHTDYFLKGSIILLFIAVIYTKAYLMIANNKILLPITLLYLFYASTSQEKEKTVFVSITLIQLLLCSLLDNTGAAFRLICYWYVFPVLGLCFVFHQTDFFKTLFKKTTTLLFLFFVLWIFLFKSVYQTPERNILAANSIYRQQYQMARFAKNFYKSAIAVNDIGLTSFNNPNKVLDLCGLGASSPLGPASQQQGVWCISNTISDKTLYDNNIQLLMIYSNNKLFFSEPPKRFILIARLIMLPPYLAVEPVVSFYVTAENYAKTFELLKAFQSTLPKGVFLQLPQKL